MKLDRSSMLYSTLILTFVSIVSQVLGFVYRIFLSRLIGAGVMGLYQLIMPVYSLLLSFSAVGLTVAVSNLSAEYQALGDPGAIVQILRRCLLRFFVLFALVAGVICFFYDPLSVYLLGDARTQLGLLLLLPCLFLTGIENLHKHYFYGTGNVLPPAAIELTEQFIRTASVLGLLVCLLPQYPERVVGIIVAGMCVSELFSSITLVLLFRRRMRRSPPSQTPGTHLNRRIRKIAIPVATTSLLGNLIGSATAILIPQRLVHAGVDVSEAMSSFGVLCGMTIPMLSLPTAFIGALGLVLVPKLARSAALGRKAELRARISRSLMAVSVLTMPAMALLVVLGPTIGVHLFCDSRVGTYVVPLSLAVLLSCYQSVLAGSLNGVGRQATTARISIFCGGVQLACTFFLMGIPGVGLRGYVAGVLLSSMLGVLLCWTCLSRATGLHLQFFRWCTAPGLSALLMGLVVNLLFQFLLRSGLDSLAACLACFLFGAVLYLAALSAQGVQLLQLFSIPRRHSSGE